MAGNDVRRLFNYKARSWDCKYGQWGELKPRVKQFTLRLSKLCPPPCRILDIGCGTARLRLLLAKEGTP